MLSYDLHVHPAPSVAPRWGDGVRVWQAAAQAGVLGFVWKAHEEHTVARCRELPTEPVRAFGSASLNPWAGFDDVTDAIEAGALWLWGPTQEAAGAIGWELPLPREWGRISAWLREFDGPLVIATGHLGAEGRAAFADLAAGSENLVCSVTHSLYVPLEEARVLAVSGCVFEVDAYTYVHEMPGRTRGDLRELLDLDAVVYFTSDGGQQSTGDPFAFGARVLDELADEIGEERAAEIGVVNPAAVVGRLGSVAAA
jgi:hypothetical protein